MFCYFLKLSPCCASLSVLRRCSFCSPGNPSVEEHRDVTSPKEHSSKEDSRTSHVVFHNFLSLTKGSCRGNNCMANRNLFMPLHLLTMTLRMPNMSLMSRNERNGGNGESSKGGGKFK